MTARGVRALAEAIGGKEAQVMRARFAERVKEGGERAQEASDLAALIAGAYPALAPMIEARPEDVLYVARAGTKTARDSRSYRRAALSLITDLTDEASVCRGLRILARREKLRVAARELLPHAGSDVDVTSRELSDLADSCIALALGEALGWAERRFGVPTTAGGPRCRFVVVGMGKLGGRELNAGSDVDLMMFYETDEGSVVMGGVTTDQTLHEHFTRVAQRLIGTLETATDEGTVWRVDMRLRPEGSRGPLVNALVAAERYYETWGRTWERAALLRARPVAGDLALGKHILDALSPFVWRRSVDPRIAEEMRALVLQARTELSLAPERDLKLGPGGIREAEFFVQSLQLIWGGKDPKVRSANTLDALRRLRARGLVTDREGQEMADAYLMLRRLEHRVQFATGLQTHTLPKRGDLSDRIARSLGFTSSRDMGKELDRMRRRVAAGFASLCGAPPEAAPAGMPLVKLYAALDAVDEGAVLAWLAGNWPSVASPDLARHLLALARRPDAPMGATTRDKHPELAQVLLSALSDAADPEQATRLLATFFARLATPGVYARALADDAWATRRLAGLFGASAFLGEAITMHPELADRLLFGRGAPDADAARTAINEEIAGLSREEAADADGFVGALRRAKWRVLMEVGLADLAGELSTRDCTLVLSALADATLEQATWFALNERGMRNQDQARTAPSQDSAPAGPGLAVLAMGKLGGREIGYGSDLDVFFVYDEGSASAGDAAEYFIRIAQRVLRLVQTPHGDGPGYELDTRLRPSGSQGLLVVSREAFARYHGLHGQAPGKQAQNWERQALLKARHCAGDGRLGAEVIALAHVAAYEGGAPPTEETHRLRMRLERELAGERRRDGGARYDLKLGLGGLVDVEFAAQWLQMKFGTDRRVRTADTEAALNALETCGYLDGGLAAPLREGYRFLRRLEQRLRVLHGMSVELIEEGAPGLAPLARRMGMRDGPWGSAADGLLERYRAVTQDVRAAYLAVLGLGREGAVSHS